MAVTILKRLWALTTHRIYNLPVLVMMPHSRCNCKCVMCDIWKANSEKKELSVEFLQQHIATFKKLGVREIVFSGGEPLMHSNLWQFAKLLRDAKINITLLSTGLLLARHAHSIVTNFNAVIVSVDGSPTIHDKIRQVPNGFLKLSEGVKSLKQIDPSFPVTGRCVLQRFNYADFVNIVRSAKEMGLDQISFLAADISTAAFNRHEQWTDQRVSEIALTHQETIEFEKIVAQSIVELKDEYDARFIAESPAKMRKLVAYYKAVNGTDNFISPVCNAPWVSAVIESDGTLLPCFFHKPYGNIFENDFLSILNSDQAVSFRRKLDVKRDPICKKCVCSLKLGVAEMR